MSGEEAEASTFLAPSAKLPSTPDIPADATPFANITSSDKHLTNFDKKIKIYRLFTSKFDKLTSTCQNSPTQPTNRQLKCQHNPIQLTNRQLKCRHNDTLQSNKSTQNRHKTSKFDIHPFLTWKTQSSFVHTNSTNNAWLPHSVQKQTNPKIN
jgi:hypothetical protein